MTLSDIATTAPTHLDKEKIKEETDRLREKIGEWQAKLYAERKRSLLVIFQGMDASGKDGSTASTFRHCQPLGVRAKPFKKPTPEEFAHDFLWRAHQAAPEKGMIQIFIRSHYEDVLIQRVHKWITPERVLKRFEAINAFEELLVFDNDTTILKFYLHLSPERQREKLIERLEKPEKNWKHNAADWEEAKYWKDYRAAYEDVLTRCNAVPWFVVPADQSWYRNYFIAKIVLETLENLNPNFPVLPDSERKIPKG